MVRDLQSMHSQEVNKIRKRSRIACLRCSSRKVKCSGRRPSCHACMASKHAHDCTYPVRSRKILVTSTDIEDMEDKIRVLEAECSHLRGVANDIQLNYSNCKYNHNRLEENRSARASPRIAVGAYISGTAQSEPIVSETPEMEPNVPGNSSCRMFLGALCRQLSKSSLICDESNAAFRTKHISNHKGEAIDQSLYLDDKVLGTPHAANLLVLPKKSYALKMVNKVFHFFAREYGLFSITEFEARIEDTYRNFQPQDFKWLAYLFITLAVGEQYNNETKERDKIPGMDFFLTTLRIFHKPVEEPDVDSVRTLLLIAFYSQGLNRMNSVFTYTGLALSTAMILGMHRRISYSGLSKRENESRRKLWWTACLMDSLWASRLGLPPHFSTEDMDVDFPSQDMSEEDGFIPRYLIANAQLALCVGCVMKEVYGIAGGNNFIRNIINSVKRLESFFNNLDPSLKVLAEEVKTNRSTENLHLRYNQMIVVTVRPLYLSLLKDRNMSTAAIEDVVLKCIDAALFNINILNNLFNSGWYSAFGFLEAQCCFSSILILVMETLNGRPFPELPMALSLNAYMCGVGNITAMNNHERLKELDRILFEAEKQNLKNQKTAAAAKPSVHFNNHCMKMREGSLEVQQQSPILPLKENFILNDIPAVPISSEKGSNLPFLIDLENSGIVFEQFSPNTLSNLSLNFQKWDTCTDFI